MSTKQQPKQAKNISVADEQPESFLTKAEEQPKSFLTKAEQDKVNFLIELSKRVKFECPPSEYQWRQVIDPTLFTYKVQDTSFIVDPVPMTTTTRSGVPRLRTEFNSPCVIKQNDIDNLITAASIPHKRMGINVAALINYDAKAFERELSRYNAGIDAANHRFAVVPQSVPALRQTTNEEDEQKQSIDINRIKDMLHILKSVDVTFRYGIYIGKYCEDALRLAPITDEDSFWSAVARIDYKDAEERRQLTDWNVDISQVVQIMTHDIYVAKYTAMINRISEHIDRGILVNYGVVHHIIFKGDHYYNLINEAPDFITWVLAEHNFWNIPKYIKKKIQN